MKNGIVKQMIKAVSVILLMGLALGLLRNTGIPYSWIPWEKGDAESLFGKCSLITYRSLVRFCGYRCSKHYANGSVMALELHRGQVQRMGARSFIFGSPLVWGYYYNIEGSLLSRIENGNGFKLDFYENGTLSLISQYQDGFPSGTCVVVHSNGMLNGCQITDMDRRIHGPSIEYHENGQRASEGLFIHGSPRGVHQRWYFSGILEERITYTTNNWQWMTEKFSPDGLLMETVNYPLKTMK